jgi:hypothetical protein
MSKSQRHFIRSCRVVFGVKFIICLKLDQRLRNDGKQSLIVKSREILFTYGIYFMKMQEKSPTSDNEMIYDLGTVSKRPNRVVSIPKVHFCNHSLLPQYCAQCKYGESVIDVLTKTKVAV